MKPQLEIGESRSPSDYYDSPTSSHSSPTLLFPTQHGPGALQPTIPERRRDTGTLQLKLRDIAFILASAAVLIALAACGSTPTATASPTPTLTASPTPTATTVPTVQAPTPTPPPPTPSPTLEPAPTAAPAPTLTPVPSSLADDTFAFLEQLTLEYSPRESATDEELAAARFLKSRFEDLGYETHLQEFTVGPLLKSKLVITSGSVNEEMWSRPMSKSKESVASGILRFAGKAFDEDIPADGLEGAIVLIERGEITFEEKVERVAEAGAVGAVVFNNRPGRYYGDLPQPVHDPGRSHQQR